MLINPLNSLPWSVGAISKGLLSFKRFLKFLDSEELQIDQISISPQNENEAASVKFSSFSFAQSEGLTDNSFALKNIKLVIKKNTTNVIIGQTGSGKTTILKSLLGELNFSSKGSATSIARTSCGKLAYVPQHPWLQKRSIKVGLKPRVFLFF